jgi:hypothetical protein
MALTTITVITSNLQQTRHCCRLRGALRLSRIRNFLVAVVARSRFLCTNCRQHSFVYILSNG